jgi:pimeloyl-ACP methyl ester carboxylesterase
LRTVDPRTVTVQHDGLEIAALDWGGDGPPLLLQHPNGFCAGVFDPLARRLRGEYRPIGVDVRGHGASERPADLADCSFVNGARDVLAVLDALAVPEVVVLGQSMGGGVSVLLESLRPGTVRGALLCEAIAFPVPPQASDGSNPMAAMARRRRAVWPDRATVHESYGARPPLNVMEPAALAAYVQFGFRDRADDAVELACAPEVEARFFEAASEPDGATLAFEHLHGIGFPVAVVASSGTDLQPSWFQAQAEVSGGTYHEVLGTHFFVQEDTERAVALVREHLTW